MAPVAAAKLRKFDCDAVERVVQGGESVVMHVSVTEPSKMHKATTQVRNLHGVVVVTIVFKQLLARLCRAIS